VVKRTQPQYVGRQILRLPVTILRRTLLPSQGRL
jgi:hypothetical protein